MAECVGFNGKGVTVEGFDQLVDKLVRSNALLSTLYLLYSALFVLVTWMQLSNITHVFYFILFYFILFYFILFYFICLNSSTSVSFVIHFIYFIHSVYLIYVNHYTHII